MANHVKKCCEETKQRIDWLVRLEQRPFTLSEHHYLDYRQKFAAHYLGWRQRDNNPTFINYIRQHMSRQIIDTSGPISRVMSSLSQIGVNPDPMQLATLLPPDPMDPAIDIMAGVRAYFQRTYTKSGSLSMKSLMFLFDLSSCLQTLCGLHCPRDR
jgi:hypothetical protein